MIVNCNFRKNLFSNRKNKSNTEICELENSAESKRARLKKEYSYYDSTRLVNSTTNYIQEETEYLDKFITISVKSAPSS